MNRNFSSYFNGSCKFDHFVPEIFQGLLNSVFNVDNQPTDTELISVYKKVLAKVNALVIYVFKIKKLQL